MEITCFTGCQYDLKEEVQNHRRQKSASFSPMPLSNGGLTSLRSNHLENYAMIRNMLVRYTDY